MNGGKKALQAIADEYYSNILLLDPDGAPLTTISKKRANWYLARNLAESLGSAEGYTDRVRLKFQPKNKSSNRFLRAILPTQCVVCGAKEDLTIHHVVPSAIKKYFPPALKNHTRQWCVLVCEKHHLEAEKLCRPLYEHSLQQAVNLAQKDVSARAKLYHKLIKMMDGEIRLVNHIIEQLDSKERESLMPILDTIKSKSWEIENLKNYIQSRRGIMKEKSKEAANIWAAKFIDDNGGIEALKQKFRTEFMKLEPKFLDEGFLRDDEDTNHS